MSPVVGYVLEVIQFSHHFTGGKRKHRGYMKGYFETKHDAVLYYDKHNPHMRSLNAYGDYRSDTDPTTQLMYIVRENQWIIPTIDCFNPLDNTVMSQGYTRIKWLTTTKLEFKRLCTVKRKIAAERTKLTTAMNTHSPKNKIII